LYFHYFLGQEIFLKKHEDSILPQKSGSQFPVSTARIVFGPKISYISVSENFYICKGGIGYYG
ncbi:hypothetical protein, partial [uncultured Megasphaera sp.]|uniref:hypothetical protein n=1 Tax=uncultured Megasphaera sp. TaxID=165188 RepID=UPI00260DA108